MTTPPRPGAGSGPDSHQDSDVAGPRRGAVLGVGVDAVDLAEFADQLAVPGTRFSGAFSAAERRQSTERATARGGAPGGEGLARHLGVRWAAKEAVVKAWSTALYAQPPAITPDELVWSEIETICDAWGRPNIRLSGDVAEAVAETVSRDCAWHVSLSHEGNTAIAFVVLASGE